MDYQAILNFWFVEAGVENWWRKDADFDRLIAQRFTDIHRHAAQGELYRWRRQPLGRLAEIIVLDQFSRNIYRDSAAAFGCDALALVLAQEAIGRGIAPLFSIQQKLFLYMPFMHSESLLMHEQAVQLFSQPGLEDNLDFEYRHKAIIERFCRYPHRNQLLGRRSTDEELLFLQQPGSSF